MFMVKLYKDNAVGQSYCVDNSSYCLGLYSKKEDAEKRADELYKELTKDSLDSDKNNIVKRPNKFGFDIFRFEISVEEIPENKRIEYDDAIYLGGGAYYE